MARAELRKGDLVEVRGPGEILATLDDTGAFEALPFMPEMAAFCGRRFTVDRRIDRLCDTVNYTGTRHLKDSVYLEDLRCSGEAHGGCQAECRHSWKEAWLRRVTPQTAPAPPASPSDLQALLARASLGTQRQVTIEEASQARWRCQATDLPVATSHVRLWDPLSFAREFTNGNVSLGHFLRVTGRAVAREPMRKLGLIDEVHLPGTLEKPRVEAPLNLQPGELVQIRSRQEIAETLTRQGRNKGLWFDDEMMAYCGRTFRVRRRITRFVNDQDGKMIELKNDCVTLDGCVCSGDHSLRRWFCGRALYPYWREIWLRRVEPGGT